jgi:hypothetical protein
MCVTPAIYQQRSARPRTGQREDRSLPNSQPDMRLGRAFCVPGQGVLFGSPISDCVTIWTTAPSIYRDELPVDALMSHLLGSGSPAHPFGFASTQLGRRGGRHPTQTSPGHPSTLTPHRGVNQLAADLRRYF